MLYRIFLCISVLCLFACGGRQDEAQMEKSIRPVRYAKITTSGGGQQSTFSGIAQAGKTVNLSFKVQGLLDKLAIKVGDKVRKGQLIARLDPIDYKVSYEQSRAQLKSAETQINSAKTQLVTTRSTYKRIEKLYENNSVPLSEFEQAKSAFEAAESQYQASLASVNAAKKQVEAAKNQVNYARLTAPFAGIITATQVEENELVGAGNPIAVMSTDDHPEVIVGIPEAYIAKVKNGQKVSIDFTTLNGEKFEGRISEVGFSANEASTYPVTIAIDQASEDIRPGMAANVRFSFSENTPQQKPYIVAPAKAVGKDPDGNFVFILKPAGNNYIVSKAKIEIGQLLQDGFEIKKGLQAGDLVATAGLKSLLDGMKVKLLE